jgi:transcriptional regulator with XRE-family HTH domain
MGRPEVPLERDGSPERELAYWLRYLRRQSGLTYRQIAQQTSYSVSALQEAAAGRRLPTLEITLAIVEACRGDAHAWGVYWRHLKRVTWDPTAVRIGENLAPPWAAMHPTEDGGGREEPASADGPPGMIPEADRHWPAWRYRRQLAWALPAAGGTLTAILILLLMPGSPPVSKSPFPPPDSHPSAPANHAAARTYTEQEFNVNGAPTFLHLDGSGAGIPVAFGQYVQVSCKTHSTIVKSTSPDGYWYLLASMPWSNHYYAVANTFGNGDRLNHLPYMHNTDWKVPDCS